MRIAVSMVGLLVAASVVGCGVGEGRLSGERSGAADDVGDVGEASSTSPDAEVNLLVEGRLPAAAEGQDVVVSIHPFDGEVGEVMGEEHAGADDGAFSVGVTLDDQHDALAVVVKREGMMIGATLILLDGSEDGIVMAPPIDAESTLELSVVAASGEPSASKHAFVELFVDASVASVVASDDGDSIAVLADGSLAATTAFEAVLTGHLGGEADGVIASAAPALLAAGIELQAALAASNDGCSCASPAALEAYLEAMVSAYHQAGCESSSLVLASSAALSAFVESTVGLGAEVTAAAAAQGGALVATALQASIEEQLDDLGAGAGALHDVEQAYKELLEKLFYGPSSTSAIQGAFDAFAQTCAPIVSSSLGIGGGLASALHVHVVELADDLMVEVTKCAGDGVEIGAAYQDYWDAACSTDGLTGLVGGLLAGDDLTAALEALAQLHVLSGTCGGGCGG